MVKNLKKKKGFTLIELIIVIAILGIIATIAIPKLTNQKKAAQISADKANAKIIADAAQMAIVNGTISPTSTEQITEVKKKVSGPATAATLGELVAAELNAIPKTKLNNGNGSFYIGISSNKIAVYTAETNGIEIYPNGGGDYAN
ncbi:prepilin-type N-terminal cleavage/methylation domain-containing protein [Clostridium bovifaecis]|uniref:Prepilin-type N-terminal cleavage/methylation domain-containing protein n=1 Tax=Clostridium bovifaecis TaxID=2184719 RepID=A0A6I6ETT6_9CLOT|nr:prepilin-type N-terminal cleavage/methylation domain-containing protein [Clostridium bovifaecis]